MTSTLPVPPMVSPVEPPPTAPPDHTRSRWSGFLRGRVQDAPWVRPSLLALLLLTGVLYVWGLGASGWGNTFYSAAVQAGSESWKAFFYGSSDAANSITVDKTPASLWVMALSARVFGVNAWSILVPQALMGVATAGLLFATVRRWYGPAAGLIAGAVFALTPVAVLMFRFNNPDALLVLLLVTGAYATVRAIENGSTRWLLLAGTLVGLGFLTKMLQALLVVPAYALAYLFAGPPRLGRRIWQLLLAGLAVVVSAGWYIAIVELVPASRRPYIGGSQNNSLLELTLGYNGLGRLSGDETGSVGGGGGGNGGGGWGETGLLRMFDGSQGGQVSWLLPAALIVLVAGLVLTLRAARTDRLRAGLILWGTWLVGTGLVFSLMQGIFHAYYTVALAPAIGAVAGMGSALLWRHRRNVFAALTLAATIAVSAWWSYHLLARSAGFLPWLRWVVPAGGVVAALGVLAALRLPARVAVATAGLALAAVLAGPAANAVQTASEPHTGSIPSAGPAGQGGGFGGPGGPGAFPGGGAQPGGTAPGGTAPGGGMRGGGMGGLLNAATVSDEMKSLLDANAGSYTWVAAAVGSQNASGYQLATGDSVMAIGGFNGSDPSPTLEQFQRYVTDGKIHYFIGGGGGGFGAGFGGGRAGSGGSNYSSQISEWVTATFTAQTVDGVTIYDLTATR
ncbi:glycosyltransferase family 39 protein [Actinoplanes sp. NPDC026623]|uniref:ArnT family glycosyltransferase n=1 Tax=Actinoplanes sp. NPDC026623 TaxID=3155610 RepID=UPI0033C0940F